MTIKTYEKGPAASVNELAHEELGHSFSVTRAYAQLEHGELLAFNRADLNLVGVIHEGLLRAPLLPRGRAWRQKSEALICLAVLMSEGVSHRN